MIRETVLATSPDNDATDNGAAAHSGLLRIAITGDNARLAWVPADPTADPPWSGHALRVSARSLILALRAGWDDNHPGRTDLDPAEIPKPRRAPRPGPPNARQPWTAESDETLRETWLAAASSTPAAEVIGALAQSMGRSRGSIRARLARAGCDPDVPGRTLREDEPREGDP
jgi:hypothetical protein